MKPSERIAEILRSSLELTDAAVPEIAMHDRATVAVLDALSKHADERTELSVKRFDFLLRVIESGEWNGLRARAEEEGLL
jgi:hypothetical protein